VSDDWKREAICVGLDPDIFFPEPGASLQLAQAICARCPVQADCLEYAMKHHIHWGIWGGVSERGRRTLRRRRGVRTA